MKDVFSSHFAADEQRRDRLWQECFFVFDTNVLTSVYKRSDDARDALYKVIRSLGDRLWIPYQVIFELLDNRAAIAHTQAGLYGSAIENLRAVLDSFDSITRHPFLPDELHKEFLSVSNKVIAELEARRDFHDARLVNDDVKFALAEMLQGKVGVSYSDEQLRLIVKEGEVRYANKVPPGFEDINKHKGSPIFGDICKRFGDLIIWKQVIEKAKELNKPVILVTGEQKDDWWDRHGGKTIGPLPHLIQEFCNEVGQDFYLYSHHQFLDLANKYLEQTTSSEVIEEVRGAARDEASETELGDGFDFTDIDTMDSLWAKTDLDRAEFVFDDAQVPLAQSASLEDQSYLRSTRKELVKTIRSLTTKRQIYRSVLASHRTKGPPYGPEIARCAKMISDINAEIREHDRHLEFLDARIV